MIKHKNIPYLNLIPIIIISFLTFKFIDNITVFGSYIKAFFSIITSFIWAFSIAYLLNPMLTYLEKKSKLRRSFSLCIVYSVVLGSIVLIITIISPKIAHSMSDLITSFPQYIESTKHWLSNFNFDLDFMDKFGINIYDKLNQFTTKITSSFGHGLNAALSKAISFTSSFFKAILGFVISIYILKDKEKFKFSFKRLIYATLKEDNALKVICIFRDINDVFLKYIIGKFIDSLIIGLLCFIGLTLLNTPYSLFLSIIVGVTNMIPYFGPFIGMIPAVILTLFYSPIKALWVLLFIFALQQFDGLYLGPKILGDQVGLTPFWIILAIVVGGGIFGVLGMFLGVPVFAVIKIFWDKLIDRRLDEKNIKIK
ncbi:AI-2E family transporter [Haloimpatiens sp. FM7315]|uniref:AI-2E family transporter n=1 Tax=Haloimpatiens sp. FM7315 TaxID=3298609 RepID=UPI0035A37BCC